MSLESIVFVSGSDEFLIKEKGNGYLSKLKQSLSDDTTVEIISGNAQNAADVQRVISEFRDSVQTLSLFSTEKVVYLQGVNFFSDSQTGKAEETKSQIEVFHKVLSSIDTDSTKVIITAYPVDRRRKDYKELASFATLDHIEDPKNSISFITEEFKKNGLQIGSNEAELIASKTGSSNFRLIANEIEKLSIYIGSGNKVTEEAINNIIPDAQESDFFETTDCFYSRNNKLINEAINKYFFYNTESRPLLAALQNRNRLMIQLRTLIDTKKLKSGANSITKNTLNSLQAQYNDIFKDTKEKSSTNLFSQNPWYLGKIAQTTQHFPLKKLINIQINLVQTFQNILLHPNNQKEHMEKLAIVFTS